MKREINELIPQAVKAVKKSLLVSGKVLKEYDGYIASFGASIVQSGLRATIIMYSNSEGGGKNKNNLLEAIYDVVKNQYDWKPIEKSLGDFIKEHPEDNFLLKQRIMNASIALKLVVRTFERTK